MKKVLIFTLIFLLISQIIFPNSIINASSDIIYVDSSNLNPPFAGTQEHPYQRIQDGIDTAEENQTIYVLEGIYHETLSIEKPLILKAISKGKTIIDGTGYENAIQIIADNVTIQGFVIKNATFGIRVINSLNNTISENTIIETNNAIYLESSEHNIIYHNNLMNNNQNGYDNGNDTWDNGHTSGGNYWDDYTGKDNDKDNIGDTPYNVPGGLNKDLYPLIKPVNELPNANFTYLPTNPTTQDMVNFTDKSNDTDGYITSWFWNFGDGTNSSVQNPTHKYEDNGIYNVRLTVTDDLGQSANISYKITILNVKPTADFNYVPATPTDIQNVNFSDKSHDLDGIITSWFWDFGDGITTNQKNPLHKYNDDGTYTITLTVTDDDGAGDIKQKQITVLNVPPSAHISYTPYKPTTNDTINFQDASNDPDGNITQRSWDLGDGTKSSEKSITHKYSKGGSYTITLTVTDDDGESDTHTFKLLVSEVSEITQDYTGWVIVFTVFIIIFIAMIVVVFRITKKQK